MASLPGVSLLKLTNISKSYGSIAAVKPLDLNIDRGDFFAILGPSGCGKTTLLRLIGGFAEPTTGKIEIEGRDVTRLGPEKRPTNMVFQGYGLFPHMSVRQNIAYGPRIAKVDRRSIEERIDETVALVRLGELQDRSIHELSGGQQQRVALARALVMRPPVLLLDEPLAALDLKLRQTMQEERMRIHRQIGGTFVFVTHDQGEALSLATRVAVMEGGAIVQVSSPEDLYRHPATAFVASFVGDANVFRGRRHSGAVELEAGATFPASGADREVVVVVRPEALKIAGAGEGRIAVDGQLSEVMFLGPLIRYSVTLRNGQTVLVQDLSDRGRRDLAIGAPVTVTWDMASQALLES